MKQLAGKTALVTGASRGIGRASALALARMGAQVLVHYSSGVKEADAVVADIRKAGGRADAVAADLSAPDGAHKLAQQVRAVVGDRLDILVANAGISKAATIEETTVADFDKLFAVNVRAPFFLVQQLLPILGSASSVILLSSLAAHAAVGTLAAYAATKGATDTLVKHLAAALGPRGIRVNAVAPGIVDTDMSHFAKTDAGQKYALSMQAIQRLARPEDIAPVVAFLASDDARWITGDTVRYDHQLIGAEGDYVIVHGRFSGTGRPIAWVAADIVRIEDGRLAEHWDVLQDEATQAESKSGLPMFGHRFTG